MKSRPPAPTRVAQALRDEYDQWVSGLPASPKGDFPHPEDPGGLPDGWRILDVTPHGRLSSRYLIRRDGGGWVLLRHFRSEARSVRHYTSMHEHDTTLAGLYARVCYAVDGYSTEPDEVRQSEEALRHFICSHYDLDDPAEAAERMLVGLGQRPTRMPASLT